MKTILLAVDIYENGPIGQTQEWESQESIFLLQKDLERMGYEVMILEKQTEITHFILDFLERKNRNNLIVFNLIEGYQSRNRESYIPALCEYLGVCYTGSDAYAQNISLDKSLTKMIAKELGIASPMSNLIERKSIQNDLPFPLFIKPNAEGSSLGIGEDNILYHADDLNRKANELFLQFDELILESYIPAEDLTVGILGQPGKYMVTDVARIVYDSTVYSEKVKSKSSMPEKLILDLPQTIVDSIKHKSLAFAEKIKIFGPARIDFRLNGTQLLFLELNLTPGLSKIYSALPMIWQKSGASYETLLQSILESAEWRYDHMKSSAYGKRNH